MGRRLVRCASAGFLGAAAMALLALYAPASAQFGDPTAPTYCTAEGGLGLSPAPPTPTVGGGPIGGGGGGGHAPLCTTPSGGPFCATDGAPPDVLERTVVSVSEVSGVGPVLTVEAPLLRINNIAVGQDGGCPNVTEGTDGPPLLAGRGCLQNNFRSAYCVLGGIKKVLIRAKGRPDKVFSRDALPGTVDCGNGSDVANIDLKDTAIDCESVTQGAVDEEPNVRILGRSVALSRSGVATIRLACPRRTRSGCRGRLNLAGLRGRRSKRLATKRYRGIRRGRHGAVRVQLGRRSHVRAKRFKTVRVMAVEPGQKGPKTTIATLRLR